MKVTIFFLFFLLPLGFVCSQEKSKEQEKPIFNYLDLKEEFDLLVDVSIVNAECATKKINYYSLIVGTTVINNQLERISVLVPCLSNQFVQADLITIKPIKTPKAEIVYLTKGEEKDGLILESVLGAEFRAIWGNVVKVL
jgi:hypothetical protein